MRSSLTSNFYRQKLARLTLTLAVMLFRPLPVDAKSLSDPGYLVDVWRTDQGLPEDVTTAMVQTPDGYLWFGTFSGLVRFDGVKFTIFDLSNTPQLPSSAIVNLHLDRDGRLWVSTTLGMASVKDGQWTVYRQNSGWQGTYVRFFAEGVGELYATTFYDGTILRFQGHGFEEVPPPRANPKLGFVPVVDESGALWVVNPEFIGKREGGKWREMIPARHLLKQDAGGESPWIIAGASQDGGMWIATRYHLRKYHDGRLVFESRSPWPLESFWSLEEDSGGNVWICSWRYGLYLHSKDGHWRRFTTQDGLSYNATRFVFEDREGSWWVGTNGGGLNHLRSRHFVNWGPEQGLREPQEKAVTADSLGRIYVATWGERVMRLEGQIVRPLLWSNWSKKTAPFIRAVLVDSKGRLWAGALTDGLFALDVGPARQSQSERLRATRVANGTIYSLFEDTRRRIWAGTDGGGFVYEGNHITKYPMEGAAGTAGIRCFAEDVRNGILWAGSNGGGLYRLAGERFVPVPEAQSLANVPVSALLADPDGSLWIGTENGGIAYLREGRLLRISEEQGLPARSIGSILDDDEGNLWLGSNRGILRTARVELEAVLKGRRGELPVEVFNRSDGMATIECVIDSQPAATKDRQGRLWFATVKGVVTVDAKHLQVNNQPPPLVVEEVVVDGQTAGLRQSFTTSAMAPGLDVTVPPGSHRLEIRYAAVTFTAPEKVHFRYTLEGFEKEWVDVGARRVIYLQGLKPGKYTFRVKASSNGGPWSQTGTSVQLSWQPHFYQTYWFLGLCALGVVLSGTRAHRLRTRQLLKRAQELEELVSARTKELRQYQEHLREQVIERTAELSRTNMQLQSEIVERRQGEIALRESEERFRALYEDTPSMYFTVHPSGTVLSVNEFGAAQLGYAARELVGKPFIGLFIEEDRPAAAQQLSKCVENPGELYHWELRKLHRGGQVIWVKETARAVPKRSGELVVLLVCEDMTEIKRLGDQLRQSQKMEAVGKLAGGVAHDFNNLLTVIKGYSRLLIDRESRREVRNQLEKIDEAADRAAALTTQLLAFSRRQVLQPRVFDLNDLVRNMHSMLRRLIGEHIEMITIAAAGPAPVKADPGMIEQVIMNLAVNARDAMPGGGKLTVETGVVELDESYARAHTGIEPGKYVLLALSDTGVGMDSATKARIFEPFFTTKAMGKGTGLGLSMVYGIVNQSGGHISVHSEPGQGATFKICLPQTEMPEEDRGMLDPVRKTRHGKETILLVEDDDAVRELARTALEACGYFVLTADEEHSAIWFAENQPGPIHVLLTDVVMPGLSGPELAHQVTQRRPGIRVLYMSGYTTNAIVHQGVLDPGTFFLPKPFTAISLSTKIREILEVTTTTHVA